MGIEFKVNGTEAVKQRFIVAGQKCPNVVAAAVHERCELVKRDSMDNTPVLYNVLRPSHEVSKPVIENGTISCAVFAGGQAKSYAVPVHEMTWVKHTSQVKGPGYKYLENALNDAKPTFAADVAKLIWLDRIFK